MLRYIYDQDEKVAQFVAKLIPHVDRGFPLPYKSIGIADQNGGLIAGAVYYNWNKKNGTIEVALAALPNSQWINRETMKHLADYAFKQRGCQMIIMRVRAENRRLLDILKRLGCEEITIPRLYGRHNDGVMCLLTDDTYNKHPAVRRNDILKAAGGAVHNYSQLQGFREGGETETYDDSSAGGDEGGQTPLPRPVNDDERGLGYFLLGDTMSANNRGRQFIDQPTSTGPDRPADFNQRFTGASGIPLPRPRPADAPAAVEETSSQSVTPVPASRANPYADARQETMAPARETMSPAQAPWSEILRSRSPMYKDEVPQRRTMRETLMDPRGRSDFLTRFGANVLAANPAHGWGSTVGQGLSGTMNTFDKFASEDMSARQKAQGLAAAIKKHTESLGETTRHHQSMEELTRERYAQDNWKFIGQTAGGAPIMMNTKTREVVNGATQQPLTTEEKMAITGRGGASSTGIERIVKNVMEDNPGFSYTEALTLVKRAGQSPDSLALRKEALALSAAKADMGFMTKPAETLEKYRRQYGLGPSAPSGAGPTVGNTKPDVIQNGRLFKFNPSSSRYEDAGAAP